MAFVFYYSFSLFFFFLDVKHQNGKKYSNPDSIEKRYNKLTNCMFFVCQIIFPTVKGEKSSQYVHSK